MFHTRIAPLVPALLGLLFCIWNTIDAVSVPCFTLGCSIQHSFTLAGISLWRIGACSFALLTLCALAGFLAAGRLLAGAMLICDSALLLLMTASAPCLSCLITALLMAASFALFCHSAPCRTALAPSLFLVWGLTFCMAAGQLVHSLASPLAIAGPADPAALRMNIYFSPSCSACRRLVQGMPQDAASFSAWYPVAETEQDLAAIAAMHKALIAGKDLHEAFTEAQNAPKADFPERIALFPLQIRLWINRGHVLEGGQNALPYITVYGVPKTLLNTASPEPNDRNAAFPHVEDPLQFLNSVPLGACRGETAVPCQ